MAYFENISRSYEEAAAIDGANRWQRLFKITLPCIMPTVMMMFVMAWG